MPISTPSAGTAMSFAPSGGRVGLTLDYGARDRGPSFRRALQEAAAPAASASAPAAAAPAAAVTYAEATYEGADALNELRRDLLSGGAALIETPAAEPSPAAAEAAGPEQAAETTPARPVPWHHDDIEGRRLGDHAATSSGGEDAETWLFGEDGFGFDDLIDVINPLQHIPIVSSIYRWITGDEIAPAASLAGGALFGGPIGLAGATVGVAVEETTGRDLGGHALAMVFGDENAAGEAAPQPAVPTDLAAAPSRGLAIDGNHGAPAPQLAAIAPAPPRATEPPAMPAVSGSPLLFIPAPDMPSPADPPAATPGAGVSPADAAIAAQMKLALDKYEAMMRQRAATPPGGSGTPASGSLYDGRL